MLVVALCASCASKQQTVNVAKNPFGVAVEMPCAETGFDNAEYIRATGTATNISLENARLAAFENAKAVVNRKLGGFVQGLSTDYSRNVGGEAKASKVQRMLEGEFATLVEKELNDAEQTCEKMSYTADGNYMVFISIQIPKKQLIDNLITTLDKNEELEIEFNRDEFRKYAEDKLKRMQEARQ